MNTVNTAAAATLKTASRPRAWFDQHLYSFVSSLGRMMSKPFSTALIIGVMAIAMALPVALGLALYNLQRVSGSVQQAREISVFLKLDVSSSQANKLASELRQRKDVHRIDIVTPEQGLKEFRELSDLAGTIDLLGSNPLPMVLKISPNDDGQKLATDLQAVPEAESVKYDGQWRQRLNAWLGLGERVVWILAVLFGLGVLLVVGNTVRLDIGARRDEIGVMQHLGATDGFIRRPFVYLGAWYGLSAGLLALGLVVLAGIAFEDRLLPLLASYDSLFKLQGPTWEVVAGVLTLSTVLGWLGAWLASGHHLRQTRPTYL
jgi:cell division transport system permease protein